MNIIDDIVKTENEIRALSWRQPYASMMLNGKRFETRTWNTNYRGYVLICASITPYNLLELSKFSSMTQYNRVLAALGIQGLAKKQHNLPLAHAIGVGRLIDCRPMIKEDEPQAYVDYDRFLFVHEYDQVTPIKPFPWKGSQMWRQLTEVEKTLITHIF